MVLILSYRSQDDVPLISKLGIIHVLIRAALVILLQTEFELAGQLVNVQFQVFLNEGKGLREAVLAIHPDFYHLTHFQRCRELLLKDLLISDVPQKLLYSMLSLDGLHHGLALITFQNRAMLGSGID